MKRRVWLLVVLLVVAALGGGGYWLYYDMTHREVDVAELGVEENFFDFSSVLQIPDTPEMGHSESSVNYGGTSETKTNSGEKGITDANQLNSDPAGKTTSQQNDSVKNQDLQLSSKEKEEMIYKRYYNAFSKLEDLAVSRLDTLFKKAKEEYKQKKDEEGFSKREFAAKYMSAAKKMQAEVDKVFYQLLDHMEAELKEANLSLTLVKEAEQAYKQRIEEKKAELMETFF